MFEFEIQRYLKRRKLDMEALPVKAVLFDMDGVLYDSMPLHARAWHTAMKQHGLWLDMDEAFMHEGRTGAGTINIISNRMRGRDATAREIEEIYSTKSEIFATYPEPSEMKGAAELLSKVKACGLKIVLVTGSGQKSLLGRLNRSYPGIFCPELMVTAFDVKKGKPDPEPYLMGLEKAGVGPEEAMVVENAPLGVQAASAARIFTIAANTGPLPDEALLDAGADVLLPSMQALAEAWEW